MNRLVYTKTERKIPPLFWSFLTLITHSDQSGLLFPQGKACRDIILNTQYMVLFNNPIDRQQVATLARRIYPSTKAVFMKWFERATSYPYGHLVIDLKSDTPEKDRLHTEIFDTTKTMDEKMAEDRGSVVTKYKEEEEEERGGGLWKRRRIEEEEEEDEEEMEEGNMSVLGSGNFQAKESRLDPLSQDDVTPFTTLLPLRHDPGSNLFSTRILNDITCRYPLYIEEERHRALGRDATFPWSRALTHLPR